MTENELLRILGLPKTGELYGQFKQSRPPGIPDYLVSSSHVPITDMLIRSPIKIVDFGQSFTRSTIPQTLKTPLVLRPPEVLFGDNFDYRVDSWSAGCVMFELMTGQPPFDGIMATHETLIQQMIESLGELPPRWQEKYPHDSQDSQKGAPSLQEWLQELLFDNDGPPDFTQEEIGEIGSLIQRLMRFNPWERIDVAEAYRQ
ncbi:MAG: hypothetical protein M1821_004746 [Bathelium mastoideum]|nr:MAG: hypothetical protein M1821_004746 [Bathelium mastoideum]KAI9692155.1 MAG: hypothetical protein M1822_006385 [Bathelium mastoideum]